MYINGSVLTWEWQCYLARLCNEWWSIQCSVLVQLISDDFWQCFKKYYYSHFIALWILSRTIQVGRYQKKHSPTHTYRGHHSSLICFLHLLRSMTSSLFNVYAWQLFCTISVQVFMVWHPPLHTVHTLYIFSPSHCLLFTAHAHTIATCSAVILRLCHLILVFLWTLYLELCLLA